MCESVREILHETFSEITSSVWFGSVDNWNEKSQVQIFLKLYFKISSVIYMFLEIFELCRVENRMREYKKNVICVGFRVNAVRPRSRVQTSQRTSCNRSRKRYRWWGHQQGR